MSANSDNGDVRVANYEKEGLDSKILPGDQLKSSELMEHNIHEKYLTFRLSRILQPELVELIPEVDDIWPEVNCKIVPLVIPYSCGMTISASNFAFS